MKIYYKKNFKYIINNFKIDSIFICPTDTIYGISSSIKNINAREKINNIKRRNPNQNIIILVSSIKQAKELAILKSEYISILKEDFPTTVILPINPMCKYKNISCDNTIGIRLIKTDFIKKIIKKIGPIYSSSANISTKPYIYSLKKFLLFPVNFIIFINNKDKNISSNIFNSFTDKYLRFNNKKIK